MSYINPLHPPVHSTQHTQYSSISGALEPVFLSPTRRRLPQRFYSSVSKGRSSPGYLHAPIPFDHPGYSKQGVPMRDLVTRSGSALASILQGAGDAVLCHTGQTRIRLRIMWSGYEHLDWESIIELSIPRYGPITRAQLGSAIAHQFARFIERARSESSRSSEWNLGSSGIRFEHLVLLSLFHVFEDVWQTEVAVDLR